MNKSIWITLAIFCATQLVIFGTVYGTITTEINSTLVSLNRTIAEVKQNRLDINAIKEAEIRTEARQEYLQKRLEDLEKNK